MIIYFFVFTFEGEMLTTLGDYSGKLMLTVAIFHDQIELRAYLLTLIKKVSNICRQIDIDKVIYADQKTYLG